MEKVKLFNHLSYLLIAIFVISMSCVQKGIKLETTPEDLSERMINNPAFIENANGENFCWHARVGLDEFVDNYELTKDTRWLDAGIKYYDFLISKMDTDPDGYKGWIGVYGYNENFWLDALVGDAILFDGLLNFSVLVLEDQTLKSKYQDKADLYVDRAKKDFIEKWDKRGCWVEDGGYGSYIEFNKFLKKDNLKEWISDPEDTHAGISHPFNKQMDAGQVCLKLYRITGDKIYWNRAEKIFFTAKSHFQYFDNHYCWNYYEPLYAGDIDLEKKDTRHGVWVHPWRSGYQARDVDKIVEAYHYGIVFDEEDIKRIINTNLEVMWNQDKANPRFISSNGLGADNDTSGIADFQRAYGHSNVVKNGGELWTGLLDFDQTIRDLYELRFKNNQTSTEYIGYKNSVLKNPPSFKRKFVKGEVKVPVVKFTECKDLYMATVLPHIITKNEKSIIICKSWIPGELQIDLYSPDDKKVFNLYNGKITEGIFLITWDGKDPDKKTSYKGDYKIRWTIGNGYREFPVVIN
ncbi:MAG: hypothetical protein WCS03_00245 [Bacteroidota bacterium]